MLRVSENEMDPPNWNVQIDVLSLSHLILTIVIVMLIFFQKCYEQKQYKNGLKFAKQILSNSKYAEHGGEYQKIDVRSH